jgi:nickel transport protein
MRLPLLIAAAIFAGPTPAFAHRLHVDPRPAGDQIRVEVFYDDDTPAQDAKVTIRLGDDLIAEGRTDDKGVWTCPRPQPGTYTVRAESVGHAATETLVVAERELVPGDEPPSTTAERARRTRTPWGRLLAGLGLIGGLWLAWLIARRATARASGTA